MIKIKSKWKLPRPIRFLRIGKAKILIINLGIIEFKFIYFNKRG